MVILLLVLWQVLSDNFISSRIASNPREAASALFDWIREGVIFRHAYVTLTEALIGFVIGALGGLVLGMVFGLQRFVMQVVNPLITALYSLPKITLAPVLIIFFGIGAASKVALAAIVVFFFVFFDTLRGVRGVHTDLIDVVSLMGASKIQIIRLIIWPAAREWVLSGLKLSVPYAFVAAVAGEIILSREGLGFLVRRASSTFNMAQVWAGLIVLLICSTALNYLVSRWQGRTGRRRPTPLDAL